MKRHLLRLIILFAAILLGIIYPYLPASWDPLAGPFSLTAQLLTTGWLPLVPLGIAWLIYEVRARPRRPLPAVDRGYRWAVASMIVGSIPVLLVGLIVGFGASRLMGLGVLVVWVYLLFLWRRSLPTIKSPGSAFQNPAPIYLIVVPLVSLALQMLLAEPFTTFSRNRAMENSVEFIRDIEAYRQAHGRYPVTLDAQWKDYSPEIAGIEKYRYALQGDAYNLFFEQPRFFFDDFGVREWVVYNPLDEQRMYSHTSWFLLLSPEEVARTQGWFAVRDAGAPHWKAFLFD
jgi:hypothetical protein